MKYFKYVVVILISLLIFNNTAFAAKADTLAGLRSELNALRAKKIDADYKTASTKSEINSAKNGVFNSQDEIKKNQDAIDKAKVEIEVLNVEISKTEETIKQLMSSYQVTSGDNIYLEFVFNSENYADLVYRYAIIEQVASYNKGQIDQWESKIAENKQLNIDLVAREKQLVTRIGELEKNITYLGDKYQEFVEITMDVKDEINSTQDLINYIVSLGCGEDQSITSCMSIHGDTGFSKPLVRGTITSYYGYRIHPITGNKGSWHGAIDIGGNGEGTKVYSSANGTVGKIIRRASCGGNQVYVHHNISGVLYTTAYFHLLNINVSLGESVTRNTVVGTVGGGRSTYWDGCSTGAHLHFVISRGWYGTSCSGDCYLNYSTFSHAKSLDPQEVLKLPNKGSWWSSR